VGGKIRVIEGGDGKPLMARAVDHDNGLVPIPIFRIIV
jgi:hypothetical protein